MSPGDRDLAISDCFADDGGFLNNFERDICLESPLSFSEFQLHGYDFNLEKKFNKACIC